MDDTRVDKSIEVEIFKTNTLLDFENILVGHILLPVNSNAAASFVQKQYGGKHLIPHFSMKQDSMEDKY